MNQSAIRMVRIYRYLASTPATSRELHYVFETPLRSIQRDLYALVSARCVTVRDGETNSPHYEVTP